jgi:2-polyprenyl-3-methyl-5-hydroxy-6-metoxy-1,4-benzoquinol methylase
VTPFSASAARRAYDALASTYDAFTADYDYEGWLSALHELATEHGACGGRLLDVACGTGRSFEPMLRRGYDVMACDISPAMVERASARLEASGGAAAVADMRRLPHWGAFDLVTCLDDAVNYLHTTVDLDAAFRSVARRLGPRGVYVFDVNSLTSYRTMFSATFTVKAADVVFHWHGQTPAGVAPHSLCAARLDICSGGAKVVSHHVQRHWPPDVIVARLERAGLECVAVRGQSTGAVLSQSLDESVHTKMVFVARKRRPASARGGKPVLVKP